MATPEAELAALKEDLRQLAAYLHERGEKSLKLSRQFQEHAQSERDASNREYDLRQATMLDYQHHVWHEIGNLVEKLLKQHEQ